MVPGGGLAACVAAIIAAQAVVLIQSQAAARAVGERVRKRAAPGPGKGAPGKRRAKQLRAANPWGTALGPLIQADYSHYTEPSLYGVDGGSGSASSQVVGSAPGYSSYRAAAEAGEP